MHINVICGLIESDGLVLITQRSERMSQPLLWEFPGGKQEQGESETACLEREVQEELCIKIKLHKRLTPVRFTYPDKTIELVPYICSIAEGSIKLREHAKYEWVKPQQLAHYNWCPADIPIVQEYLLQLNQH